MWLRILNGWSTVPLVALLLGCGGEVAVLDLDELPEAISKDSSSGLTGSIVIDGSSTVFPISEAAVHEFGKKNKQVKASVGSSGTGGGFKRFTKGETDVSDASRPIKQKEHEACKDNSVAFIELPVAYDGLTFVVHPENTFIDKLTVDQLKKIFRTDSQPKTWEEVDPAWPKTEIKMFIPGADSGTFDYFKEVILAKDKAASIRGDAAVSTSEDDNQLVTGVARDKSAIGFFGVAYYEENKDKLKAVEIVNPQTGDAVTPERKNIESGVYAPFSRPLFIYVRKESLTKPQVQKFVEYYLDNAGILSQQVGYVALPQSIYDVAKKHLADRLTGTHFLMDTGEKRSGALAEVYKETNLVDIK